MDTTNIWEWLIQQAPVIVVMGIVIYWLAKRLDKCQNQKDALAEDVVKLTTLWEEADNSKNEQILSLLREIKDIVRR